MFKVITGTLQANHNTMQITENIIENSYIYEVYVNSNSDVIPQSIDVSGHTLTVTFDSKPTNNVVCKILMFDEYISSNDIAYQEGQHTPTVKTVLEGMTEEILDFDRQLTTFGNKVNTLTNTVNDINERIPTDTVLGGVLYHSTTGNTWKKLDSSNIDYDEGSTIYSAMGDIDDLSTTSKNLVSAINEVNSRPSGGIIISSTPVVIGKFDNKNLYCKYITGNIIGGDFTVPHNIENLDLIIDYDAYRYTTDSNKWLWKSYARGTNRSYSIIVNGVNATNFDISVTGWTSGSFRIVVYYTLNE